MTPRVGFIALVVACVACDRGMSAAPDGGAPSAKLFELLDDMESGQVSLPTPIGLASWYVAPADPSTVQIEWEVSDPEAPRGTSLKAQHVRVPAPGTIDLKIDIHGPSFSSGGPPYPDVSGYAGVAFWARRLSGAATLVASIEDDQVAGGRSYAATRASTNPWFEHPVTLTPEWRRHILLFDDFRQPGQPDRRLRTQALWSIHFVGGLEGTGAEFWIDDLALLCRNACPTSTFYLHPTPGEGMDVGSLPWVEGEGTSPDLTCAVIAPLSMTPLSGVTANAVEKFLLRVRIPVDPPPAVPQWGWVVEALATGEQLAVNGVGEGWSTVAIPITQPGSYRVVAHTHYPGNAVCGVETTIQAQ